MNPTESGTTPADPQPIEPAYDVVVVGARAAGASTAMLLARRGLRVLAVDRSAYGSDTLSTHAISIAGVHLLDRWGVLDRIRDAGTPVSRAVVFNYGAERVRIDIPARGGVDGLYNPRRTLLDATLVDHAVAAGADVRHGVSVAATASSSRSTANAAGSPPAGSSAPTACAPASLPRSVLRRPTRSRPVPPTSTRTGPVCART
jgi:glycine/D-amino acid oxidase-like deaminating enzyme